MELRETSIFILAEEEDMGFAVKCYQSKCMEVYILISTVDTYISGP